MAETTKVKYVGPPGDALVVQMPDSSWRSHEGELETTSEHADDLVASGDWERVTGKAKKEAMNDGGS